MKGLPKRQHDAFLIALSQPGSEATGASRTMGIDARDVHNVLGQRRPTLSLTVIVKAEAALAAAAAAAVAVGSRSN